MHVHFIMLDYLSYVIEIYSENMSILDPWMVITNLKLSSIPEQMRAILKIVDLLKNFQDS